MTETLTRFRRPLAVAALLLLAVLVGWWAAPSNVLRPTPPPAQTAPVPAAPTEAADVGASVTETADEPPALCDQRTTEPGSRMFGDLTVSFTRVDGILCRIAVRSPTGELLAENDSGVMVTAEYADLDGDEVPELLLATHSGGSAGYTDTFLFTQRPRITLLREKLTWCNAVVRDGGPGIGPVLATCDLSFAVSAFESLCNACTPRPAVYLKLEDGQLRDVGARLAARYDEHIAELRARLMPADLQAFVASSADEGTRYDATAKPIVLAMLLDYLYSGRPARAREVVDTMWPKWDRERIWEDVLGTSGIDVTAAAPPS